MVPAAISGIRALTLALTSLAIGALASDAALASQGPGAGAGTAGHLTQTAMAIIVYGTSALIVCAGLIGAARGQKSN
jgi:hypothetical protein